MQSHGSPWTAKLESWRLEGKWSLLVIAAIPSLGQWPYGLFLKQEDIYWNLRTKPIPSIQLRPNFHQRRSVSVGFYVFVLSPTSRRESNNWNHSVADCGGRQSPSVGPRGAPNHEPRAPSSQSPAWGSVPSLPDIDRGRRRAGPAAQACRAPQGFNCGRPFAGFTIKSCGEGETERANVTNGQETCEASVLVNCSSIW